MPAVKYAYDYYNRNNQGVARKAMSSQAYYNMNAQRMASSNVRRNTTPEATKHSTRMATRSVATAPKQNPNMKKRVNHESIDIPIVNQRKITLEKPEEIKLTKPKSNSKAKTLTREKAEGLKKKILIGALGIAILFMICMRYTQINEKFNEVGSLEKNLSSAQALNEQLSSEIESKTDLNYIEKYAKYQLGMQKPKDSQIVRIAFDKQDKISTPVVINEEKEESFFEKLWNDLKNLID